MKTNRRTFLTHSLAAAGTFALSPILAAAMGKGFERKLNECSLLPPSETAGDEEFWYWIQQAFTASPNVMNLNNGGVSPQPKVVQEKFHHYNNVSNEGTAYYMWQVLGEGREPVRKKLAGLAGCPPEELAIQRNTTEALDNVIFGLPLKRGDEVILLKYDYPNVINAWKQREQRDGIVIKWVELPQPAENEEKIVSAFEKQITARTKVLNITHIVNWTGQILPAKKLARAAHKYDIDVIVDGAHSFAHLDFNVPDLECDYFGTSLHKWLFAPLGTGFLYAKKEKISKIWPLFSPGDPTSDDIRKFEAMGTRSFPAELTIGTAVDFHYMIGSARKEERLRYLKNYWMDGIKDHPKVKFFISQKPEFACGLGNFTIEGKTPGDIQKFLMDKYKIFTVPIVWEEVAGVRVTPNVYTTTKDLDLFIKATLELAG